MRIALFSPLPPEQSGIADYAENFVATLEALGVEIIRPLQSASLRTDCTDYREFIRKLDWRHIDVAHGELGGGRLREYHCLQSLRETAPQLPITATIHDPERLIWRPSRLPGLLDLARHLPRVAYQAAVLCADPATLKHERQMAGRLHRLITLTQTGANHLRMRMQLPADRVSVVPHGNLVIAPRPLPPLAPLKLLYFGFIYRGKGLEDLIDALALAVQQQPGLRGQLHLTLAGGTAPEMTFGGNDNYLSELQARMGARNISDMISLQIDIAADSIPDLIQSHHVMVLPYRESGKLAWLGKMRGTSGALSWAAACGRGAIASDARAFPEEVARGNGIVFPQGDVASLAHIFIQLAEQPKQVCDWARAASVIGLERQWPRIAERFLAIFSAAIERARHAS